MKRVHFQIYFLSDDREPRLSRFQSVEGEDEVTETVDDAEGVDFDKEDAEEDTEEEDIGGFWGGMEDLDSMARVNWVCVACEASGRGRRGKHQQ